LDEEGRLRADGKELDEDVQRRVMELWPCVSTENPHEVTDFVGYESELLQLFCFGFGQVNYDEDVNPEVPIPYVIRI
jgi:enoyl-[acyl-carrier protein] reductase / trans-2-enoyl-CoA reductase (NAD+)